jgi:hypothetical protein
MGIELLLGALPVLWQHFRASQRHRPPCTMGHAARAGMQAVLEASLHVELTPRSGSRIPRTAARACRQLC